MLRHGADLFIDYLASFEVKQCRNITDAIFGSDSRVMVHVDLTNNDRIRIFTSDFLDDRADHAARTAPFSPKVNYYRFCGIEYRFLEIRISYF